ncbi:metallophosphoesterase family protein [Benzoatithermus flavus]|uniref:Metallophosphoesterase n=1 Tax=Benzoatithermus flavus TaxID=3108223 RepID=A0ABU8XTY1_9PROT
MTFRLAHLSDLHLAPLPRVSPRALLNQRVLGYLSWQRRRYRVHRREVLDALVADLREQAPDHVAITGDLVNISLPAEFVQAAAWLRQLGGPDWITVIPGNHDAYVEMKWREAWAHWSDYMCGDGTECSGDERQAFPFVRRRGDIVLIGLSTAVATPPTFATGRLGRRQLGALDRLLDTLDDDACRVVLLHHPPVATMTDYRRRLVDADAFGAVLKRRRAELVLCGHQHVFQLGALPAPDGGAVPVVGAPSASLHGGDRHHEGGYIVYDLAPTDHGWAIDLELRRFDPTTGSFARVFKRCLRQGSGEAGIRLATAAS